MSTLLAPTTLKRIQKELADVHKDKGDLGSITLEPTEDLLVWKASIPGPEGSPYEGGVFNVDIRLNPDYPFSAPRVLFLTRIYHMNISDRGAVCLDILKHNWSPALSLFKVVLSISSLLTDPNPRDPLVSSIATEYQRNRSQHDRNAMHWTELYAKPKPPPPQVSRPAPQTATRTVRNKGKQRQDSQDTIEILDSDEDCGLNETGTTGSKRKRGGSSSGGDARGSHEGKVRKKLHTVEEKSLGATEVIVIDD